MANEAFDNRIVQLEARLKKLEQAFALHQHTDGDGTQKLRKTMFLDQDQVYTVGSTQTGSAMLLNEINGRQFFGIQQTGPQMQQTTTNRFPNLQLISMNLPDDTSRLDNIYARGNPTVTSFETMYGTISVTAGGSTVTINNYSFAVNELAGAYVVIYDSDFIAQEIQPILSNTASVITIDGTWWNSTSNGSFEIYAPVYLGNYNHPFKQVAVIDGDIPNGIRFGGGIGTNTPAGFLSMIAGQLVWQNNTTGDFVQISVGANVSDSFTTVDGKTVTVLNGIVASII